MPDSPVQGGLFFMNVKVKALDQHKVQLTIEVPADVVVKGFKEAVARISNQVKIQGFRPGKAPRKILEMRFGKEAIVQEAEDIVINRTLNDAVTQEKLVPVTTPNVEKKYFSEAEGTSYTATFVKEPEVTLGEYKGLKAAHENPEITDEMVMEQLKRAAEQSARLEKAADDTVLAKGDIAVIDFKGSIDGKAFEGGEGKTYPLEIGSQSFIPGFEDQLKGHKAGDDVLVKVKFPEAYGVKELAGKAAEFSVHINSVKHKVIPAIDDAFVKSVSQYETVDELKKNIKQQMQLQALQGAEEKFHKALIEQAVKNASVDIPREMIDKRIDEIVEEVKLNLEAQEMNFPTYLKNMGKTEADFRKTYDKIAEDQVREGLILAEIAKKENLNVTNQDVNLEIYSMARQFNADPKDVVKIIKEEGRANMLYQSVLRKKAAAFIYGAAVKEEKAQENEAEKVKKADKEVSKKETKKAEPAKSSLASKTVKELKAYAEEKGIAIDSRAKKAEIIEAIEAAESKK